MKKNFIFLELLDPEVNSLLWRITDIISGTKSSRPVHLTIRGPYANPIPESILDQCRSILKHDVIRISGVGRFSNSKEEVVYFRVDSPHMREVWWKPDYPIEKYGYEPHVSVYRGINPVYAGKIAQFLENESIELLCAEFQIVSQRYKQLNLFSSAVRTTNNLSRLIEGSHFEQTLFTRLETYVHHCKETTA